MQRVSEVLWGKSFEEQLRWMSANPPDLRPGTSFADDERCPACGGLVHDASWADGPRCRCEGALRRCLEHVDRADPEGSMSFEHLDLGGANSSLERAAAAAKSVAAGDRRGLAMFGPPGVGKSHVAIAACRAAISQRIAADYHNVVQLVGRVQATYRRGLEDGETRANVIEWVASRDLVVLDDLGKERRSDDIDSIVYELVDAIYRTKTRLILCSNLGGVEYRERYDEAVTSRIAGMCGEAIVGVLGEDRRRAGRTA